MKAQADQKRTDMETAMLGGEREPKGMIFYNGDDQEYGDDGFDHEYGDDYDD